MVDRRRAAVAVAAGCRWSPAGPQHPANHPAAPEVVAVGQRVAVLAPVARGRLRAAGTAMTIMTTACATTARVRAVMGTAKAKGRALRPPADIEPGIIRAG